MIDEIIELLPSESLKAEIKRTGYQFSEADQLQIIYSYAKTFRERQDMLERFSSVASPSVSETAMQYRNWQQELFGRFCENRGEYVYELHIKTTPDSYDERYICGSFEASLILIDLFYTEYSDVGDAENDSSLYRIEKRRIFAGSGQAFSEDYGGECVLGPGKELISVCDSEACSLYGDCDGLCDMCEKLRPERAGEVKYPCFVHDCDVVEYTDENLKKHFGVCRLITDLPADSVYIIPLDSDAIRYRSYENAGDAHIHVEAPLVELASTDAIDEEMRMDCLGYIEYLKSPG